MAPILYLIPTNPFNIDSRHIFMNYFFLYLNFVDALHQIICLIFIMLILYLVIDPSSLLHQKSGIFYPIHFGFLHALVHPEKNLKVFFFHLRILLFFLLLEYLEKLTGLCLDTVMWIGCNSRWLLYFFYKYSC